jgi:hypothetical protein
MTEEDDEGPQLGSLCPGRDANRTHPESEPYRYMNLLVAAGLRCSLRRWPVLSDRQSCVSCGTRWQWHRTSKCLSVLREKFQKLGAARRGRGHMTAVPEVTSQAIRYVGRSADDSWHATLLNAGIACPASRGVVLRRLQTCYLLQVGGKLRFRGLSSISRLRIWVAQMYLHCSHNNNNDNNNNNIE